MKTIKRLWNYLGQLEELRMKCMAHMGHGKF